MKALNKVYGDEELRNRLNDFERGGEFIRKLTFSDASDAGVELLVQHPRLHQLEDLCLRSWQLTDAGIATLIESPAMARLRQLELVGCTMTDARMQALVRSPVVSQLHWLRFRDVEVTPPNGSAARRVAMYWRHTNGGLGYQLLCPTDPRKGAAMAAICGTPSSWRHERMPSEFCLSLPGRMLP